ncbi:MAG TPA: S8 family serine peptidase [Thermoanaerobaculia bacterium]|nr:S8 family serine peptidase [Thermoanaerobaculia bacterium]
MATLGKNTIEMRVVDVDRRPIEKATVLSPGIQARADSAGRFTIPNVPAGRMQIRVEAEGYEPVEVSVDVSARRKTVDIVLGEPGMPAFRRRNVPIPFRSPEEKLGVIARGEKGARALEAYARERGLKLERPHGRDLTIIVCDPGKRDKVAAELRRLPEVKEVGRLVNPGIRGTGMLTQNIMVRTVPGTSDSEVEGAADRANCRVLRKLILKDRWLLSLKQGEGFDVLEAAEKLDAEPFVLTAEPDVAFTPEPDAVHPTDELYGDQWHLTRINAADAWQKLRDANAPGVVPGDPGDITFGSANILLAVVDTGVKSVTDGMGVVTAEHPDFQGTVTDGQNKVTAFFDFGDMVPNCDAPDGNHGTCCAGVAAARANNASTVAGEEEGVSGVAPNVRILAIQGPFPCTEEEFSDMYLWIAGFDPGSPDPAFPAQLAQGADVITNSWGAANPAVWPISALMDDLFTAITDDGRGGLGTLMFFSTGNASSNDFWEARPFAAHERNFGIGASTDGDVKADYSNWGDGVDLCAPSDGGVLGITTTTFLGTGSTAGHTGGSLDYRDDFGGTSSATPTVAGVAALLLSMDPTLTHGEARTVLTKTAKRIDYANADADGQWRDEDGDGVKEYSWWYGFGMVDAARAVCVARNTLSVDPAIQFVNIPEDEPAIRPVTIRAHGWRPRTFHVTDGPNTTVGPADSFVLHAGDVGNYPGSFDCADTHVHIWIRYTGTTDGDFAAGNLTVTCDETGETFPVDLTANTIARPKTALVLALDRSGSMDDPAGDGRLKIELVRDGAAVVPVICDDGTGLGAVRWDSDADIAGALGVQDAGDEMGGAGRTALADFVNDHTTNIFGATAIGDAVQASQSLLNDSSGYALEAMCVLTDGNETESLYLSELDPDELHSRIYAIGVGTPENINPAALATIAGSTDGYLLMTGNIDDNDTFLLTKYFQQILAGITNTEITVDPQGFLTPGASLRLPFPVNEVDWQVDAILHTQFPELVKFEIEAPDGQIFGPAQASGIGARFVVGRGSSYYRLNIPSSIVGPQNPALPWHARIELSDQGWEEYWRRLRGKDGRGQNPGAAVNGLRYAFTAQARSTLRMDVNITQSSREPGAMAVFRASLREYGYPLLNAGRVWAVITDPKGTASELELAHTGGGIYKASLVADMTGAWRATFHSEGKTSMGSPFLREAIRTVAVWPGGDRPAPHPPSKCRGGFFCCLCAGFKAFLSCLKRRKRSMRSARGRAARHRA